MEDIRWTCATIMWTCVDWFEQLLVKTDMLRWYLGYVFTAMATGFLLKRFGSSLSLGSDKAAQHFKRRRDK